MDSDSYTSQLIAGVTGGAAPALDNKDAGLHSQLIRARFSSTVPPTTANLLGAGTLRPAPGSTKSTDSYAGSAALLTEFNVGEVERQYYIEREGLGEPVAAPLFPPSALQLQAGTRTLTFAAAEENPVGVTYVAYARKVGTTAFVRLRAVVATGTVLEVTDGLFAKQDIFVRAELEDQVSAYSDSVLYIYIPAPLTLSAVVGPGTRQVTLTIGSSTEDPADLVTAAINLTYTSTAGTAALPGVALSTPISGGDTTTHVITLGNANEEYTITVAGVGDWGVAAASTAVVVTPRIAPQIGTASLTLQVNGAALSLGALAVDAANPLLGAGNIRVIFRSGGSAPVTTTGTVSATGGIISIVRTNVPSLAAGVVYAVSVQPLASYLNGPETVASAAFTFGLPMNIGSETVTATAVPPTGTLRLAWGTAGTYDTSAPITGYRITRSGAAPVTVGVTTTADISGLTPGVPVTFQIIAVNANGVSPVAAQVTGTALTYSQPPTPSAGGYDVFQLDSTFAFKIAAVQGTTEQPVEGYRIFSGTTLVCTIPQPAVADLTGKTIFVKVRSGAAAEAAATAEYQASYNAVAAGQRIEAAAQTFAAGFSLGTSYGFRIAPYNFVGEATGITVGPKVCITTPARTVVALAAYSSPSGFYKLTWTASGSVTVGAPVDRYVLYIGGVKQGLEVAASATTWTGLTLTAGAAVAVAAENLIGVGAVPTAVTVPVAVAETAVTDLTAAVRYESLEVSWAAKATTWGLATTSYTVTLLDGASQTVTTRDIAAGTQTTTFAVTLGEQYSVRLVAKNTLAETTPAATAGPYTIASAGPTITAVTGSSHTIVLGWTQVSSAWGAAVTGYRIYTSVNSAVATLAATVTGAATVTATLTGLQNLVTVVVSVAAVNAAGQETTRTAWATPVTLAARIPELEAFSAIGGLGSGLLRLTVPAEKAATNPDSLVGTATYDLTCTPAVVGLPAQLTLGAAGTTYDLTGFANGTTYTLGLRRTYTDVAPWTADTYKTGYVSTEAAAFAPLALTLTSAVVAGTPLTARVGWSLGATPVPPAGTYYRVIRVTAPGGGITYVSAGSAAAADLAGTQDIGGLTAGSNSFSVAITRVALAGADVPAAVWTAAGETVLVVQDVPSAPVMTNALVFDEAGSATDTLTATGTATTARPITQVKIYEVSTPADLLLGTFTGVSVGSVPYTYALAALGTTKSFYAVATNTVGDSARGGLSVLVQGSPPYAPREATAVSVTASTITGAGATVTVGWTKYEPNATYFPVSEFRVEVLRSSAWTVLSTYAATATTSGALNVTTDVNASTTIQLRVVQVGAGGSSTGVQVSRTYTKPTLGSVTVSASSVDKVISIPWTYTGDLGAVTALGLAITLPAGGTFTADITPSASGTYTYTAAAYGVHGISLTPRNVFGSGTAATASVTTVQPAPGVPVLASAVGGIEQVTATFSVASADFVAGYTVDVSGMLTNVASSPATIAAAAGSATVRVRSYNSDGLASAWSNSIVATVQPPAPAVPVLDSVTGGVEQITATFSMTSTAYVAGYTVDVSGTLTNVAGSPATIAAAVGTAIVRVRSYNINGLASAWSNTISVTVKPPAPAVPTLNSVVGDIEQITATFSMTSTAYVAGYTVDVSGVLTNVSGSPATIAAAAGTATVRVRSYNSDGLASAWSNSIVATVQPPTPPVPTLTGAIGGTEFIDLSFTATPTTYIAGYTVDMSGTTFTIFSSPATIPAPLGTYAVRVRSFNASNVPSAYSNAITVTVVLGAPKTYTSIAGGVSHTAALLSDGTMRTWGNGGSGQLGNGSNVSVSNAVIPTGLSTVISIACGGNHTAALLADGTMRIWGNCVNGQLGINASNITVSNAVTPCNISNCVAIACGISYTAALLTDGTMRTWGRSVYGELGNGSNVSVAIPVTPTGVSNVVAIACGGFHTAALLADGTVRTWGFGTSGQLGNNSNVSVSNAVTACNISNCVSIACGQCNTAALLADGTMRTWGNGSSGQLGNGSTFNQSNAVAPTGVSNVVAIACGEAHVAALLAGGTMKTWGSNVNGQLGNGIYENTVSNATSPTGINTCIAIACGGNHTAALLADGTMRTWGFGTSGQLGNGSNVTVSNAVTPTGVSNVAIIPPKFKIATVPIFKDYPLSTALLDISTAYQPGSGAARGIAITGATGTWQISTNSGSTWTTLGAVSASSAVALRGDPAVQLRATNYGTDALTVKAWSTQQVTPAVLTTGVNTTLGGASIQGYSFAVAEAQMVLTMRPAPAVPVLVSAVGGVEKVTVTFSVTPTTWVAGYTVDVGGVTTNVASSPATISATPGTVAVRVRAYNIDGVASAYSTSLNATVTLGAPKTFQSIAAGFHYTAALLSDGTMRTWGNSSSGQLGNGSAITRTTAVTPTDVSNVIAIACGSAYTAALLADGTMRTWGDGANGQLGNGLTASQTTAVIPTDVSNVVAIACGYNHTAALLSNGTMRTWGQGVYGQLGNGTTTASQTTAVTPTDVSNVVAIACGGYHTAALIADGTMRTWGGGATGALGIGSTAQQLTAVTPTGVSNVVAIACCGENTAALLADGTMRTWGTGENGRLGNGSSTTQTTAVTPTGVTNVVAITCGREHMAALLADGTVKIWGNNVYGQLGNGSTILQTTAVTLTNVSTVVAIACGSGYHTAALLSDGTMRTWGWGTHGQLGNNTTTASQTTAVTPWTSASNSNPLSNISIIKPSFKVSSASLYNNYPLSQVLLDIPTGYQPGVVSQRGIAITGAIGTWQISTNSGSTWTALGAVTASSAVVLRGDPAVQLRATNFGTDTLTVKAWSTQQTIPAVLTTAVNTTLGEASLAGYSFSTQQTPMVLTARPAPAVPSLATAVGGAGEVTATFSISSATWVAGYTIDVSGVTTNVASSPATITAAPGTVAVRVRAYNADGINSEWSNSIVVTITSPPPPIPVLTSATGWEEAINLTFTVSSSLYLTGYTIDINGTTYNTYASPATIANLTPGTYTVKVRSYNAAGTFSAYSNSLNATVVIGTAIRYNLISAGYQHTAVVTPSNTVLIWGNNSVNELGIGSSLIASSPTAVTPCNISNCISIACMYDRTAALLTDRTVKIWGNNTNGLLGNGSSDPVYTPITLNGVSNCVQITGNDGVTLALIANGTVRGLGIGILLGLDSSNYYTTTITVPISNCIQLASGLAVCAALLVDGTLRTWGNGSSGQLGNQSSVENTTSPVTPCNISNCVAVACGYAHVLALIADGTVRAWGENSQNQLGDNTGINKNEPIMVSGISNCVAISANDFTSVALLANGTVKSWGTDPITPNSTNDWNSGISNCIAIASGIRHHVFLLADGTLRTIGWNEMGQLGTGTTNNAVSSVVTPLNIPTITPLRPRFKTALTTTVNQDLSFAYFLAVTTGYQPGNIPYRGIAITATTGTWQYSTNTGSTWTTISGVTATAALALRLEPTVRIRCTAAGVLTVKAWSAQQATPATVTSGVDTTVATATIQGYSFAAATTTITAT